VWIEFVVLCVDVAVQFGSFLLRCHGVIYVILLCCNLFCAVVN
jgi:hypothetical protein